MALCGAAIFESHAIAVGLARDCSGWVRRVEWLCDGLTIATYLRDCGMFCGMILRECLFRRIELRQRRVVPRACGPSIASHAAAAARAARRSSSSSRPRSAPTCACAADVMIDYEVITVRRWMVTPMITCSGVSAASTDAEIAACASAIVCSCACDAAASSSRRASASATFRRSASSAASSAAPRRALLRRRDYSVALCSRHRRRRRRCRLTRVRLGDHAPQDGHRAARAAAASFRAPPPRARRLLARCLFRASAAAVAPAAASAPSRAAMRSSDSPGIGQSYIGHSGDQAIKRRDAIV